MKTTSEYKKWKMENGKNLKRFYDKIVADREIMTLAEVCKKWGISKKSAITIGKSKKNIDNKPMTNEERERWLKEMNERDYSGTL